MTLTHREFWTALHGMILGAVFLLAFSGTAFSLWNLRAEWATPAGQAANTRMLLTGSWTMALMAWLRNVAANNFPDYGLAGMAR
jgi:hypothetical protein